MPSHSSDAMTFFFTGPPFLASTIARAQTRNRSEHDHQQCNSRHRFAQPALTRPLTHPSKRQTHRIGVIVFLLLYSFVLVKAARERQRHLDSGVAVGRLCSRSFSSVGYARGVRTKRARVGVRVGVCVSLFYHSAQVLGHAD